MATDDVLIVGGGHAGAHAAVALRQNGYAGTIGIVGAECELPYERPPLSKEYLSGTKPFERMLIRPKNFWQERKIAIRRNSRVIRIDPDRHQAFLEDGDGLQYGQLIWATGGSPRRLGCPGDDLRGIHYIRTRADVDQLRSELHRSQRIAIIGGGYIGLETAAVLNECGKQVVVLEAMDRVLARVAGEQISAFYEAEHRSRGVTIRTGVRIEKIDGDHGQVFAVVLAGGERLRTDLVVVGIGIAPAVEPLTAAGALGCNGILVDRRCRTTLPDVYAIGDCAVHESRFAAQNPIRLESVQNASDQAAIVAKNICGIDAEYDSVPWFWSNQFDLKLQTVGLSAGHDTAIVRGELSSRSFSVIYLRQGQVIALDCVNATRDYVQGRALVQNCRCANTDYLRNTDYPLKELVA